ncbi:MAG TPA: DUF1810 domain-containing protein [Caulobacteraceae bacterium]|nr:DUF1810 domain-containing protein [Caulobacteraceae bacterium]
MSDLDPFDLQRFVDAQEGVIERVRAELAAGRKESHWMWFVFPQFAGLGSSPMSVRFALSSRAEAAAYLAHPVLGPRLRDLTGLALGNENRDARAIFGPVDALKFRSSLTLFAEAAEPGNVFRRALDCFFDGQPDPATLARLD